MYATVRTYSGSTEFADALVANEADVKRIVSEIDGFNGYYLIRTADGAVSISVYADEAGAEKSNQAAAKWVADNLPGMSVGAPQVSAGEVVIST